jgi:hypothetical protein
MSGPQLGTYITHPDQMDVQYPSNVDDTDISSNRYYGQPLKGPPTEMTYTIARIRLCTIIRELADAANKAGVEVDELEYGQILIFDKKLNDLYDEFVCYFQHDNASDKERQVMYKERPYLEWQRDFFAFGLRTRLARLHRPFLARGYKDPRYSYSRMVCLQSAREVIDMKSVMRQLPCGRLWIVVYHVFLATITLVMDYCSHRDDPRAAERRQEILCCYKFLEESEEPGVRQGLAHLNLIMNEWRKRSNPSRVGSGRRSPQPQVAANPVPNSHNSPQTYEDLYPQTYAECLTDGMGWPETTGWTGMDMMPDLTFQQGDFDTSVDFQWEALFRDLELQQPSTAFSFPSEYSY